MMNDLALSSGLPSATFDLEAIDRNTRLSEGSKYQYKRELQHYVDAGYHFARMDQVVEYAQTLKPSRRALFRAGLRIITADFINELKANASPINIGTTQAALLRLEAVQNKIEVPKSKGTKTHSWLTSDQVRAITTLPQNSLEGFRDWIILGLLLGAGLRCNELIELEFSALKKQPHKGGGSRDILEVKGKGGVRRIVPINPVLASRLREWKKLTGNGKVVRAIGRANEKTLKTSISGTSIFKIIRKYGALIGVPELAPHDLRRTYAEIRRAAGEPIMRISKLLGHSSTKTTELYFNLELDLDNVILDAIPLYYGEE